MTNPDAAICGMCVKFSTDQTGPEYAAIGMARCLEHTTPSLSAHVAWNATCPSFALGVEHEAGK